ncbi:MAG: hypothetical protein KDJ38_13170 [Gammaproteobacteria bacterium]|nr:hypothetical protein [Gammaproteobacteria bacterium]
MQKCESCGMPIESGKYCQYCVDDNGHLQDFETRFARMKAWQEQRGSSPQDAEKETLNYMAGMPAWRDHPELKKRLTE